MLPRLLYPSSDYHGAPFWPDALVPPQTLWPFEEVHEVGPNPYEALTKCTASPGIPGL